MTPERGFQVYYATTDEAVLQEWHERLGREVECGRYRALLELARANQPLVSDMRLVEYVTGFKY